MNKKGMEFELMIKLIVLLLVIGIAFYIIFLVNKGNIDMITQLFGRI